MTGTTAAVAAGGRTARNWVEWDGHCGGLAAVAIELIRVWELADR